ncbi:hypothetical protein GWC95_12635 [Sediminibacterium roseum]|uniref:Uncharacterized protein n=1 Tax=Sediminibacterium roseum TaxID=1978412 RepID=A0ABW9ZUE9_9BACT|nr:hypothetical protein [Sediminibacterium roseum]NCI50777.1 hypothetical protein [Sediminibacterium roseum]
MKNVIAYMLACLIVGTGVYLLMHYVFGLSSTDSIWNAAIGVSAGWAAEEITRFFKKRKAA